MPVNRYYSSTAVDTNLAVGISSSATSIIVASTTGFPTSYPYTLAIDYDTSLEELVNVVGASGTTLTVGTAVGVADITGRGVDQGAGYRIAHAAGAVVKHIISGRDVREPQEHIAATTSVHGIADTAALITETSTSILTNKSLTAPVLTGTVNATAGTLALGTTGSITANSTTISATELGYVDGVTSNIQTQLGTKAPIASPTFTGTVTIPTGASITNPTIAAATLSGSITNSGTISGGTVSLASGGTLALGYAGSITAQSATIDSAEMSYLDGVTSNIQGQFASLTSTVNSKLPSANIQSGKGTTSSTADGAISTTSVSFPTAFTNAPIVTVTPIRTFTTATPKVQLIVAADASTTGFSVFFTNNSGITLALPFNWIAVGS